MRVLLISTYDLGHQPFGLASPAAWLRADGHAVTCADLSIEPVSDELLGGADAIGFHLPMHSATRLAIPLIERARTLNPRAVVACYGLYAPLNDGLLRGLGVRGIFGGEFEGALAAFLRNGAAKQTAPLISLDRLPFAVPDRAGLPSLDRYPRLRINGERIVAGYTEASRGCKHLCRHCPVVPVYRGVFRVVPRDIVIEDIRRQVCAGARHITFGDPDFFNGPSHGLRIVEALHRELPGVTYDVTIKIEHLRKHAGLLPGLRDTGCLFITSAVESIDDAVLAKLDKGHTRADFIAVAADLQRLGLTLSPTFIPFTPWTSVEDYRALLTTLAELGLAGHVNPVQLALRLLLPAGSLLLDLPEMRQAVTGFDERALLYRWRHLDPSVDRLAARVLALVYREQKAGNSRRAIFRRISELAGAPALPEDFERVSRTTIPYLEEPWYC